MKRLFSILILVLSMAVLLTACGGKDEGGIPFIPPSGATLVSIEVTPANPNIALGAMRQFKATGRYSDSSTKVITASVTWSSTDEAKATISAAGLATLKVAGPTTIRTTSGGVSGETALTVRSEGVNLSQTGQAVSYAEGDDGNLQRGVDSSPQARFATNADTTVKDNFTGLVWATDAGTPAVGPCTGGTRTWQQALDYVACLNTNNYLIHSDWRLPNRKELRSLIDYSQYNPALQSGHLFTNVQAYYWSSTTFANPNYAWCGGMNVGFVNYCDKTYTYYVWPVSGPALTRIPG